MKTLGRFKKNTAKIGLLFLAVAIASCNAVQHRCVDARLIELSQLARIDRKVRPVDDRLLRGLVDLQISGTAAETHITMNDNASRGICLQW